MHKVPTLTVIAGRPASNRPFETTHRTEAWWKQDLRTAGRIIVYGLIWFASFFLFASLILSLGGPR